VQPNGSVGKLRSEIDVAGSSVEIVEILREALPLPAESFMEGGSRDVFDAFHELDEAFTVFRDHRSEAHAAVAHHNGGHPVPTRWRERAVPRGLAVIVGVDIDKAGSQQSTGCINFPVAAILHRADCSDDPTRHRHIGHSRFTSGSVNDGGVSHDKVIGSHSRTILSPALHPAHGQTYSRRRKESIPEMKVSVGSDSTRSPGPRYDQCPMVRRNGIAHSCLIATSDSPARRLFPARTLRTYARSIRSGPPFRGRKTHEGASVPPGTLPPSRRTGRETGSQSNGRSSGHVHLVRREVGRFALLSAFSLVVVVLILGRLSRKIGTDEAINDAKRAVYVVTTSSVGPELSRETVAGLRSTKSGAKAAAVERMDRIAAQVRRSAGIERIKLWDSSGDLLYADEHRLLTTRIRLGAEEMEALRLGLVEAEISDLSKAENQFDRGKGRLLEVYLPVQAEDGTALLFESYLAYGNVIDGGRRILLQFAPSVVLGLIALQGVGVLLVWSVARRLRRAQQQRELLLQHALEASDTERRRIAADLHDGVVQDLTGMTLGLAANRMRTNSGGLGAGKVGGSGPVPATDGLTANADLEGQIREVVHSLRSLIVEIYPPNLRSEGLTASLRSLCARLHNRGITTSIHVDLDERDVPEDVVALSYRVTQEALRNVSAHAEASHVDIRVEHQGDEFVATIDDDGKGFDPNQLDDRAAEGHVGLRGLGDLVAEKGGSLRLQSGPNQGTAVVLRVPLSS
jgi:two-component system, NarL family, sensor kinase